jgi:hypothetical protein
VQFCEANLLAAESLRGSSDPFLRWQAGLSARNARDALPVVRMVGDHPPSPRVQARVRELEALAARALGRPSPLAWAKGAVVRAVTGWKARRLDPVEREPVVSDPGVRWTDFRQDGSAEPKPRDARAEAARARRARKSFPPPPEPTPVAKEGAGAPRRRVHLEVARDG